VQDHVDSSNGDGAQEVAAAGAERRGAKGLVTHGALAALRAHNRRLQRELAAARRRVDQRDAEIDELSRLVAKLMLERENGDDG
jgi:hypothetical protein